MSSPKLCVSVMAPTLDDLRRQRDAVAYGDLVELRLDGLDRPDASAALAGRTRPAVVTCRPAWEGGFYGGTEDAREAILTEALERGADYVDVEWAAPWRDAALARDAGRVVLSVHDWAGTPPDLADRARAMLATGAGVVKLAVTATCLADLRVLLAAARAHGPSGRLVLIAMGPRGVATRVLAARFRSCWAYAGDGVAPGRISERRLVEEFRFREVGPSTPVYAVVGRPVGHSLSPAMHNAAFGETGVDGVYVALEPVDFADFAAVAPELDLRGCSVTAPFKRDAWAASSERTDDAQALGVANTLTRTATGWAASNTDVAGFLAPLAGETLDGARVTILGAGGAARAAAMALRGRGARVTVVARRPGAAAEVAATAGGEARPWPPEPGSWDVLVNATPVGTWPSIDSSPVAGLPLDGALVYDLVSNPLETALLRDARQAGCRTIAGVKMLVAQAALQFTTWTGRPAPSEVMARAAARRLEELRSSGREAVRPEPRVSILEP